MSRPDFKYEKLAKELSISIRNGNYRIGEKLPSIREIHRQTGNSIITVSKAFEKLEQLGLIETRPKSGHYVAAPKIDPFRPPAHKKFEPTIKKVSVYQATGSILSLMNDPNLTSFGCSIVRPELLPQKSLSKIIKGLTQKKIETTLRYSPVEGEYELRKQIARRMLRVMKSIQPEDIIITNGCMAAITLCLLSVAKKGDSIVVESPSYPLLLQTLQGLELNVVEIPSSPQTGFDVGTYESVLKKMDVKACIVTGNFSNPLGTLMPDENKMRLVQLAAHYDVPIIENDIYSEMYYEFKPPTLIKSFDESDMVFSCSSFSKTLAPGLGVGWVIPNKRFYEKILRLKVGVSLATASVNQLIISEFISSGAYDRHLRILRQKLFKQTYQTALSIQTYFPGGTRLVMPKGGFMIWVELPKKVDSKQIFDLALKEKILTIPGIICANTDSYRNYMRFSCASPFTKERDEGIKKIARIVKANL